MTDGRRSEVLIPRRVLLEEMDDDDMEAHDTANEGQDVRQESQRRGDDHQQQWWRQGWSRWSWTEEDDNYRENHWSQSTQWKSGTWNNRGDWDRGDNRLWRGIGETPADTLRASVQARATWSATGSSGLDMVKRGAGNRAEPTTWETLAQRPGEGGLALFSASPATATPTTFACSETSGVRGFAPESVSQFPTPGGLGGSLGFSPHSSGVSEIKCPSWDGRKPEEWQRVRRKVQMWSLIGNVHPAFQAPVFMEKLTEDAAHTIQHLKAEDLMYPGGLLEVVSALDAIHASEADATRFRTFEEAFEASARSSGETLLACAVRIRAGIEKVRRMGISLDGQIEGYLVQKKMRLTQTEALTLTAITKGDHHIETVMMGLKRLGEHSRDLSGAVAVLHAEPDVASRSPAAPSRT